jgi:hypothetical protein
MIRKGRHLQALLAENTSGLIVYNMVHGQIDIPARPVEIFVLGPNYIVSKVLCLRKLIFDASRSTMSKFVYIITRADLITG